MLHGETVVLAQADADTKMLARMMTRWFNKWGEQCRRCDGNLAGGEMRSTALRIGSIVVTAIG